MAKTLVLAQRLSQVVHPVGRSQFDTVPPHGAELSRHLLWLISLRALILLLVVNLAEPLGLLPARLGPYPFLPVFNVFVVTLTLASMALWWGGWGIWWQLRVQVGADLLLTTALVAQTRGIESVFVSFYVLIIIYCSLMLGHQSGTVAAALSTILYSGIVAADHLGVLTPGGTHLAGKYVSFRTALNAAGFFAVAFLGTRLYGRLGTMQEQLEEKIDSLEDLRRLNEHIVSSIRSGLITTTLDGRIAVFNNTAAELTERRKTEVLEQPLSTVIGEGLWTKIQKADLFSDAKALRHEDWLVLPSGARRYLGFSVSPLMDQDNILIGFVVAFQDLTEIKRLEEEVRLKDRMAAIGRMAAGIAHEIRNPLTSMRGSVEILRSHLSLPQADERLFDILIRESDRLNKFVEDFLQFARPNRQAHERVDLVPLLRDFMTLLHNTPEVSEKYNVWLDVRLAEIPILGSADQLRQVFWNLARNGLRAMPDGGTLTVVAQNDGHGGGQLTFRDSGIGMTPEEKSQLFQPFHSGFKGGTGLGLSIVFQIMEDHHGRLCVESEKGHGTSVVLNFPPLSENRASVPSR